MLLRIGAGLTAITARDPFGNVLGASRSLLASATFLTLAVNGPDTLFVPPAPGTAGRAQQCDGAPAIGLFCVAPSLETGRLAALAVLLAVIAGWRPRWTCVPHWYVAFSVQNNATVLDGGDQVCAVVTLLLVPVGLCDDRRWHWTSPVRGDSDDSVLGLSYARRLTALAFLLLIRVQVFVIYFQAGVAKLGVQEWADGTAMYYWLSDPVFGATAWQQWVLRPILVNGFPVTLFTWSVLVGEIALAIGVLVPWRLRRPFLSASLTFHAGIAFFMGITTFSLTMAAVDLLAYRSVHDPLPAPAEVLRVVRRRGGTEATGKAGDLPEAPTGAVCTGK